MTVFLKFRSGKLTVSLSTKVLLTSLIFIFFHSCKKKESEQIFELPITYHDGYGPFEVGFSRINPENAKDKSGYEKTYQTVTGIPEKWSHVKKGRVHSDFSQFVFQNFKAGNISKGFLMSFIEDPGSTMDTTRLSAKPIKCVVNVIWGTDESGNWAVMIDTNNDLDFSDELPFAPDVLDFKNTADLAKITKQHMVTFEALQGGRIVSYRVPLVVKQSSEGFLYNFPRYASASLVKDGKEFKIFIESSRPCFEYARIAYPGEDSMKMLKRNQIFEIGKNLELGGLLHRTKYKNLGVDWYNQTLKLEGVPSDKVEYILQEGYQFQDFEGREFTTGKKISTKELRGKYVYIDFWGTWCKGCVQDLPKLNELYSRIDKSKFMMVGIAEDGSKNLKRGIDKHKIEWPQLQSSENGNLIGKYKVTGFPTSVLLDKTGKIIAVNLRSPELEETIDRLK